MKNKYRIPSLLFATVMAISVESVLASERAEKIKMAGEIKVCIWPDYFAISYRNPRTHRLEGIDIDMARELAKSMNVKLTFVDSSFSLLVENMQNNACDIAMHAIGVRDDRKPYMEFSQPYLASGIYGVGTKNNIELDRWDKIDREGVVVVVQKGTYMEPVVKARFKHAEVSVVDSFKAREQEVLSGRADVFMGDYPYAKRMVTLTNWAVLLAPDQPFAKTNYAYAVPKGETDWLKEVDAFLLKMKANGKLAEYAEKNGLTEILVQD
ncbi:amino acid ABC transporter substrate-binding protein [Amphritea opalescens]|uniref:Amino acid ABC transporter substrate-binding protein n=1 Tax=Amphritea opalescens TaxID=2490544 RepID=A0A430KS12_9GAMM|nr:ABC transporter substrate-binding protein [Amphritea opalescens]RTE66301.1 amino acid ABC transporter substrate-binding protein [Amphritea opalescens]